MASTYTDLGIVHRYIDQVMEEIKTLIDNESRALVMACQVFEEHQKLDRKSPFTSEQKRLHWLKDKARKIAAIHLRKEQSRQHDRQRDHTKN